MSNETKKLEVRQVLTAAEADDIFGMKRGTSRQACLRGQFDTARKSGGTWLIHYDEALERWYDRLDGDLVWSEQEERYYIQKRLTGGDTIE